MYNQNASDQGRLVNNHSQDLTFGAKVADTPQVGARGRVISMQNSDDNEDQSQLIDKIISLLKQLR